MNNTQFTEDCKTKLQDVRRALRGGETLSDADRDCLRQQEELLQTAIKIMTYGTGQERRRFRRDYERRVRR